MHATDKYNLPKSDTITFIIIMVVYHIKYVHIILYTIILTADISCITRSVKFQFQKVYKWPIIIILLRIYMMI